MENKVKVGQRVTLKNETGILSGEVLSVNREFTIIKFDSLNEITLLRKEKIIDLILSEEVSV